MSKNEAADQIIRDAIRAGNSSAGDLRKMLGVGGSLRLSSAVKRLGLKASAPGEMKGPHTFYAADTTFSF
jgi:hypothetical protein